jgi:antitoxin VapB
VALNIKDPETDRLARELAARTGESITKAVSVALTERLDRIGRDRPSREERRRRIYARLAEIDAMPVLDDRPVEELLPYDEHGVPI